MKTKYWLMGWGLLALIALAAPGAVAFGLMLIVPGLILLAAPTVFLYSVLFLFVRHFLALRPEAVRSAAAAAAALMLGWLMAQPWAMAGRRSFARANLADVVPASPLRLAGSIRLELPPELRSRDNEKGRCKALCALLLDTPGVESVSVAHHTFRLTPRAEGDRTGGATLWNPESILQEVPQEQEREERNVRVKLAAMKKDQQAVAAAWGLRLASREKLVSALENGEAEMTIRVIEERRSRNEVSISRLEILDRNGRALARRSVVTGSALSAPLRFDGHGALESFRVGLARDRLRNTVEYTQLEPVAELFRLTTLAPPQVKRGAIAALLERLYRAAGNPKLAADDPDLGLAALWLPTVDWSQPVPREQLTVLSRVIADGRIALPGALYEGYESKVAPELRAALASRIRHAGTPPPLRTRLAKLLARMPDGTFAEPTAEESAILERSDLRADAYPLIVRVADRGDAAVPALLEILRSDRSLPLAQRIWVMRAVSLAFATLGPKAKSAIAEVDAMVNEARSPLLHNWNDRERWYLALARMGKPVEDLDWRNKNADVVARNRAALRRRLERFDPNAVWNY
ncbi:MAG: hypothetical protein JST93_34225 [Acidobacteria bacterium]|nr:hypothetical protein [Acidobacteriota bacterium]